MAGFELPKEISVNDGDNVFGKGVEPTQTILAPGLTIMNLECETATPIIVGSTVRNVHLSAPVVDILESGMLSGEVTADDVVIRGRADSLTVHAKRFYASATAKLQNCTIFMEGRNGCGIHKDAEFTGEIRIAAANAPAKPRAEAPKAAVAPKAPVAQPASAAAAVCAQPSVWDHMDEALSSAATADGHAVLTDSVEQIS
ncbi:hypothetical protein AD953_03385 [Acetobacter malorum]|uniref:Integral membrane protein CcmA involved in cell shape determination n=1 Tax=Acetobacter malorum TaxID=178901 RepID=A0A149VG02_9PROT|nr:hypothetical protein AD953_03385 [Acetobacter malorum]